MSIKKIKKVISTFLIILLFFGRVGIYSVLASEEMINPDDLQTLNQEAEPETSTPEDTEVEIENEAIVENEISSTADTGENEIIQVTPTPAQENCDQNGEDDQLLEGCDKEYEENNNDDCSLDQKEGGCDEGGVDGSEVQDQGEVILEEGENETSTQENPNEDSSEITSGDAISVTEVVNDVNSTEVGSEVIFQTLNIFIPGDINLSLNPLSIIGDVINEQNQNDPVITVAFVDSQNFAYVSNDIVSVADTGGNSIEGSGDALIDTGNAYSIVSLLNKVNTTIINSKIHILTINIFGDVEGNIFLPEYQNQTEGCCGVPVNVSNSATVTNNVESEATTGKNTIIFEGESDSSIETGDAQSVVNVTNIVNSTLVNVVFHYLYINNLGVWIGNFLGWDGFAPQSGGESMLFSSVNGVGSGECIGCVEGMSAENSAYVENNISSYANTGGNLISGNGSLGITTGNAYSSISIYNFVNTSIINSLGFFGSINIFGVLKGNIGGASLFETKNTNDENTQNEGEDDNNEGENTSHTQGPVIREAGGELLIYQYNNINDFVYPGDTVTFFIEIKNPGTGRVYDTKLTITLINEAGLSVGGVEYELGDLKQREMFKITNGIVLSPYTIPGTYTAYAEVSGYIGPDNYLISSNSISFVPVNANMSVPFGYNMSIDMEVIEPREEILGALTSPDGMTKEEMFKFFVLGLAGVYVPTKSIQKRKEITEAVVKGGKQIGTLLTSFFA